MAITGLPSAPVEIVEAGVGRLLVSRWNFGAMKLAFESKLTEKTGPEFVRAFFGALARRVPDDAAVTLEAFKAGELIREDELATLPDDTLEDMARQYLQSEKEPIAHGNDEDTLFPNESNSQRLERLILSTLKLSEESNGRLLSALGALKLNPDLHASLMRTADLAKGLDGLIPRGLFGEIGGISALSKFAETIKPNPVALAAMPEPQSITKFNIPPHPAHKTNAILSRVSDGIGKLTEDFANMLSISQQQAALIQSLSETATLALAQAASSAENARESAVLAERSTRLTKYGVFVAIVTIIISAGVSVFSIHDQRMLSNDTDHHLAEIIDAVKAAATASNKLQTDLNNTSISSRDAQTKMLVDESKKSSKALGNAIRSLKNH